MTLSAPISASTVIDPMPIRSSGAFRVADDEQKIVITGSHYEFHFDRAKGKLTQVRVLTPCRADGESGSVGRASRPPLSSDYAQNLMPPDSAVGLNWDLPVQSMEIIETAQTDESKDVVTLRVRHGDERWQLDETYEVYARGYVICTFELTALVDQAGGRPTNVCVPLDEQTVFSRKFEVKNDSNDPGLRQSIRGMSVNFTVDDRPVTHSVDFLLESVTHNLNGKMAQRVVEKREGYRNLGWKLTSGWAYPFPKGFTYRNRWCLSVTAMDNSANAVRGQRICHWSSMAPAYPSEDMLDELHEYGCSILIMHMPSFKHIDGCVPLDTDAMRQTVQGAHQRGMKVLFYCQPYLVSINGPDHQRLLGSRTECLNVWNDLATAQVCSYEPDGRYDADELCLRCEDAFEHIYQSALDCLGEYDFDGLYIDWAWPAQGLCSNLEHDHDPGLFNFYDYLRMLRQWRKAIGPDKLMIGHGGGFLVGSDMVEGFDACLTGEAQEQIDPAAIGQQFGAAPTLWTLQRRKADAFRSHRTIEQLIEQGMTPHIGVGVTGTAVVASLDTAHHPQMMALWQMWRAFPMHRAATYTYLTPGAVALDNDEVAYSLYVTPEGTALLLLANTGGVRCDDAPAIGVNVELNLEQLGLSDQLHTWRMKGNTYETFRIDQVEDIKDGKLTVQELDHHEFIGFVLSPDEPSEHNFLGATGSLLPVSFDDGEDNTGGQATSGTMNNIKNQGMNNPPAELTALIEHLAGRPQRAGQLLAGKQQRLTEMDQQLDQYAQAPISDVYFSYAKFMEGRVVE